MTNVNELQGDESPGCWSKMKRSCFSKLPKRITRMSSSPKRGLPIGLFLLVQTIVLLLILVGVDMVTDGNVLVQMWPHTMLGRNRNWTGGNSKSSNALADAYLAGNERDYFSELLEPPVEGTMYMVNHNTTREVQSF